MDLRLLDDQILELAYKQALTNWENDRDIENYKIYARLRFFRNLRQGIQSSA